MTTALKNERQALIFALLAVLCWSTVATAFKLALDVFSARWLLAIAVTTSWLFLTCVLVFKQQLGDALQSLQAQPWLNLRNAMINPVCYYLLLFQAYDLLPAQQAQAINYTWAITMSLLAIPLLGQKLRLRDQIALLLAYLGVLIIATRGDVVSLQFDSVTGVLLALASTILWALYWILNTLDARKNRQANPAVGMWASFLIAAPVTLMIAIATDGIPASDSDNLLTGLAASVYIGLFEMGLTFLLWQHAMNLTSNTAAISSLIFLSPFLSLVFISQILGEPVEAATLYGLIMIVAGLAIQKLAFKRTTNARGGKR